MQEYAVLKRAQSIFGCLPCHHCPILLLNELQMDKDDCDDLILNDAPSTTTISEYVYMYKCRTIEVLTHRVSKR